MLAKWTAWSACGGSFWPTTVGKRRTWRLSARFVRPGTRGAGVGQALAGGVRGRLAESGVQVLKISVIAGNDRALRFYQREGAVDFTSTLVMPVSRA
ncbi:GNAT family N-acetyltransferase [Streptomyces sp. NPDC045251]|uniref:GNAT family N-acetyltransferase n=1 Tax=unclassified Streptomyces TaxID=2593676 RepID=UPI0033E834E3